jgi:hypothetical protein
MLGWEVLVVVMATRRPTTVLVVLMHLWTGTKVLALRSWEVTHARHCDDLLAVAGVV